MLHKVSSDARLMQELHTTMDLSDEPKGAPSLAEGGQKSLLSRLPHLPSRSLHRHCQELCPAVLCLAAIVGMSVVPLFHLVWCLEAWLALTSLSCWVIRMIRLGYVNGLQRSS